LRLPFFLPLSPHHTMKRSASSSAAAPPAKVQRTIFRATASSTLAPSSSSSSSSLSSSLVPCAATLPAPELPSQSGADHITVAVRVRPQSARERAAEPLVRVMDDHVLAFDAIDTSGVSQRGPAQQNKKRKDMLFAFDSVFDSAATQQQVYGKTLLPMLDHVLDGINVSVFAYGVSGSFDSFDVWFPLCCRFSFLFLLGNWCWQDPHDAGLPG